MKVYLCGAINGRSDADCKEWRERAKQLWPDAIDPMRRDYRGKEEASFSEIVEGDKADIDAADVLLVHYDGTPSVGTAMEMLYAWERGKHVVVVCAADARISPWMRYHCHRIVHTLEDAL